MNELKIHYPFKPFIVTQRWGVENSAYAKEFGDPNWTQHNGIDANVGKTGDIRYQTEFPIYCPVEGFTVLSTEFRPKGSGNAVWLISDEPLRMWDREDLHAYIGFMHGKKILVKAGDKPKLGELLMIGDNTGFSTGPHCHMGLYRVEYNGQRIVRYNDTNHANMSFDPEPFFTKTYAIDRADVSTIIKNCLTLVKYFSGSI
jgi:murein DD-endopeptidase MepM/ murein hydrolase activator NlpD